MQHFTSSDVKPNRDVVEAALKDFGFYHDFGDVARMYAEYVNHGNYGYAGGVMDQPDAYWHDMYIMKNLALWVEHYSILIGITDGISIFDKIRSDVPLM